MYQQADVIKEVIWFEIKELEEETDLIGGVAEKINVIAKQTNLLALNANIEAPVLVMQARALRLLLVK